MTLDEHGRVTRIDQPGLAVTSYRCDEMGNLLGVALPDGRALEYLGSPRLVVDIDAGT